MTRYSTLSGEHVSLAGAWKHAGFHGLAMVKAFCSSGAAWMLFFYEKGAQKSRSESSCQLVEKGRQLATFFSSYHPTCSKMYVG